MSAEHATLIDYWFGELPPDRESAFEEHLFGCAECTAKLEELAALGESVRAAWRSGAVRAVIPGTLLDAMKKAGLRLREYRVAPGESVNCTIAGVRRVDLVTSVGHFEDVPFDAATGEVLSCPAPAQLKRAGAFTYRARLVAVEDAGERVLGEYTFVHTPS
jgi:anti-sigma factor RsiW